jgi:hypothetical protein
LVNTLQLLPESIIWISVLLESLLAKMKLAKSDSRNRCHCQKAT